MANGFEPIRVIAIGHLVLVHPRMAARHFLRLKGADANEARPPDHQSVKRRRAILSSIDDLPRQINLIFMLLFKPILDRAL
jgi:hypothetical protein